MTTLPVIHVDTFSLSRSSAYKELYFPRKILKAEVDVNTFHHFIVVVVDVDDDTYYWVYLSSDHLIFHRIPKCDKCYYTLRQVLQSVTIDYKVREVLQSETIITKCDMAWSS